MCVSSVNCLVTKAVCSLVKYQDLKKKKPAKENKGWLNISLFHSLPLFLFKGEVFWFDALIKGYLLHILDFYLVGFCCCCC